MFSLLMKWFRLKVAASKLARLREQFEADKTRIAKMRAERKFKPF